MIKLFFTASLVLFLSLVSHIAHADVTINEIMYDLEGTDTDREWIEVYNSGSEAVDLSTWKFVEGNSNHGLVPFEGSSSVPAGGYAIIADKPEKFKIDWPSFSGILLDSSFSLGNDPGEELSLKDQTATVVDTVTYVTSVGAAGDGKTLNRSGSAFVAAPATPGTANASPGDDVSDDDDDSDDTSDDEDDETDDTDDTGDDPPPSSGGGGGSSPGKQSQSIPKMSVQIMSKTSVIAGVPILFEAQTIGYGGELLTQGKFVWNFGDGASLEVFKSEKIVYTYDNPGEYVVSVEYTRNQYQLEPDMIDRVVVQVTPPLVVVSSVGLDGSIEITNQSSKEVDLSKWTLQADGNMFLFPKNTIILGGRKIMFASKVTHFPPGIKHISIILPSSQVASVYPQVDKHTQPAIPKQSPRVVGNIQTTATRPVVLNTALAAPTTQYEPIELSANALSAAQNKPVSRGMLVSIAILAIVIVGGGAGVWYVRNRPTKKESDAFDLVE